MKAQVLTGVKTLEYVDKPLPVPNPTETVVKVEFCGICGTDVHCYETGLLVPFGTVLGHEITGVVSAIGSAVEAFKVGDRVAVNPIPRCGKCYWCERGQFVLCSEGLKEEIGITLENDGGFAEYVAIKYPQVMLHHLPDTVPFRHGALVEPLATSLHAVRMSRLEPGDSAMVFGAGMIGLGVVEFLRIAEAGRIIVAEPSPPKRQLAEELGADYVFDPGTDARAYEQRVLEITRGIGPDIVFECSGNPAAFQDALRCVRKGGQVVAVGFGDSDVPLDLLGMILKEIELKAILGYYDEFTRVLDFLRREMIHADAFISEIVPLRDLERGIHRLLQQPETIKILVEPRPEAT
jgi:threonine dehydrogenase-like Zn-dependent dehydrogenase